MNNALRACVGSGPLESTYASASPDASAVSRRVRLEILRRDQRCGMAASLQMGMNR